MSREYVREWEQILGLPVNGFVPFRRNVRLATRVGDWVVKPVRDPAQLGWWLSVDRELRLRGFQAMPPIYSDGNRWLITPVIDGTPVSYRDRKQVLKAARLLAAFHYLGRGLATPPMYRKSHHLLQRLDARLSEFGRLLETVGDIGERLANCFVDTARCTTGTGWRRDGGSPNIPSAIYSNGSGGPAVSFIRIWRATIG